MLSIMLAAKSLEQGRNSVFNASEEPAVQLGESLKTMVAQ
jgi:hypothetical protein